MPAADRTSSNRPPRLLTLDDLPEAAVSGQPVFVRVDFNVPLQHGAITDDTRLREALPTLEELRRRGARLVLASHLGRPKGRPKPELSLRPVAFALSGLLGAEVLFADDCVGEPAQRVIDSLRDGGVCLLENLRFHEGEEANDATFTRSLAKLARTYVDDAFGTAHRAHASTFGVAALAAHRAAGRLLVREVDQLSRLLDGPAQPFVAVLGGAKVSGKIAVLEALVDRVAKLLVGGGMANTLLLAQGRELGDSLVERDHLDTARRVLERCGERGVEVLLPEDLVVTADLAGGGAGEVVESDAVPRGMRAVDVGPRTRERFGAAVRTAATVFWNGPLGVFEQPPFDAGTLALAAATAECQGFSVVGGGETVAAVQRAGVADRIGHVSTGGGASLELIAGEDLPGVRALARDTR
jgi:phosphoglycerate kinase